MAQVITNCCCGSPHKVSDVFGKVFTRSPTTLIGNHYGLWRVPRIFLMFHGTVGMSASLEYLAQKYWWENIPTGYNNATVTGYHWWPAHDREKAA